MIERTFSITGGTTTDAGTADALIAPIVVANSVSLPTNGLITEAWWKFVVPGDAQSFILFDTHLSYVNTGALATVTLQLYAASDLSTPLHTEGSGGLQLIASDVGDIFEIVPGHTYYLRTTSLTPNVRFVLRVSPWTAATGWIQPPDQTQGLGAPNGGDSSPASAVTGYTADYPAIASGTKGPTYHGKYDLDHSFGNPNYPGEQPTAIRCLWYHARVGRWANLYWSSDGGSSSGGSACIYSGNGDVADAAIVNWPIGATFSNTQRDPTPGGGHQHITCDVWAQSQHVHLTTLLGSFNQTAGADPDTDPDWQAPTGPGLDGLVGPVYEESLYTVPELIAVEAMPIELTIANHSNEDASGVDPQWYVRGLAYDAPSHTDSTWGPKTPESSDTASTPWHGGDPVSNTPETFIAAQDAVLTPGWNTIDPAVWAAALATEADSGNTTAIEGLHLTGLPNDMVVYTTGIAPLWMDSATKVPTDPTITTANLITEQIVVLRLTMRPSRIKFTDPSPVAPEVITTETGSTVEGELGDLRTLFS